MKLPTLNEMLRNSVIYMIYGDRAAFKVKKDSKFVPINYQQFSKIEE